MQCPSTLRRCRPGGILKTLIFPVDPERQTGKEGSQGTLRYSALGNCPTLIPLPCVPARQSPSPLTLPHPTRRATLAR